MDEPKRDEPKSRIRRRFAKAAGTYDAYADVQQEVAALLERLLPREASRCRVLEIGCGTGNFTGRLTRLWPQAEILALDFAEGMIGEARRKWQDLPQVHWVCADAEEFLAENESTFDLVVSNATLQWFGDPDRAVRLMAERLVAGGRFYASVFGPRSLHELGEGLKAAVDPGIVLPAARFYDRARLTNLFQEDFSEVSVDEHILGRRYDSLRTLLGHIRKTGTGGWQQGTPLLTRKRWRQLEEWFVERGGFEVSYQVFMVRAVR